MKGPMSFGWDSVSPLERWGCGWVGLGSPPREPDNVSRAWGACIDGLVRRCGCPEDPVDREHVARSEWSQASHTDNWRASGPDNKSGSWGPVSLTRWPCWVGPAPSGGY
ncbi:hypothetical protein TIFTF001_028820 [Ficus carica]|uniref:Uncharacterized protein n=1 Tax=Ficus carica TaxID=3494 RepID=A0AA88IX40_FICCA|nr:hypothetical protein TIFTF001_028820 [Ficus carica]